MIYNEYMRSDLWLGPEGKRIKRLEIDKYECRLCGGKDRLEVHHKPESYKRIPNESVEDDLTTLCVPCHKTGGGNRSRLRLSGRYSNLTRLALRRKPPIIGQTFPILPFFLNERYYIIPVCS